MRSSSLTLRNSRIAAPAGQDLTLVLVVHLEHAVRALDHDRGRRDVRGLQRAVQQPMDLHAGGDLDEQRRHAGYREIPLARRTDVRGELRLQAVDELVRTERNQEIQLDPDFEADVDRGPIVIPLYPNEDASEDAA
jgi:hypothetical protein